MSASPFRPARRLRWSGESGSGKSTAARAILRLLEVDSGEVLIRRRRYP
ncbi:ATP-binding cassette domain-containing protein [uncultured Roseibium sp.]